MKKLVKKNRVPKAQIGALTAPWVLPTIGTAIAGTAAYPYIKNLVGSLGLEDVDWRAVKDAISFSPRFITGKQLIEPQLAALNDHLYTGLGEGVPMRLVVVTPEITDYTMEWNPVTALSRGWKKVKTLWEAGQTDTQTPEPQKEDEDKDKDKKIEEGKNGSGDPIKEPEEPQKPSKWRTYGKKVGNGIWKWGVKRGLGIWGGLSGGARIFNGVGYGLQDDSPSFVRGFLEGAWSEPNSTYGYMLPTLINGSGNFLKAATEDKYKNYRKEHPLEPKEEKEENKEKPDSTITGTGTINTGRPRLNLD